MAVYSLLTAAAAPAPAPSLADLFVSSAQVDLGKNTVTLPLYKGTLNGQPGTEVFFIVTDASSADAAARWGANAAAALAAAADTPSVQMVGDASSSNVSSWHAILFCGSKSLSTGVALV